MGQRGIYYHKYLAGCLPIEPGNKGNLLFTTLGHQEEQQTTELKSVMGEVGGKCS